MEQSRGCRHTPLQGTGRIQDSQAAKNAVRHRQNGSGYTHEGKPQGRIPREIQSVRCLRGGSKLAQQQRQMPRLQPCRPNREHAATQTASRIVRAQGSEHRPKAHVQRRASGGAALGEANRSKMIRKISRCLTCNLTVSVTGIHEPCTSL